MSLRIQPSWTGKLRTLQRLCNPALSPCCYRVCTGNPAGTAGVDGGGLGQGLEGFVVHGKRRWRQSSAGEVSRSFAWAFSGTGSGSGTDILNWVIWDGTR